MSQESESKGLLHRANEQVLLGLGSSELEAEIEAYLRDVSREDRLSANGDALQHRLLALYSLSGKLEAALSLNKERIDEYTRTGQQDKVARALVTQATLMAQQFEYRQAAHFLAKAIGLLKDYGDQEPLLEALLTSSALQCQFGAYEEAVVSANEAAIVAASLGQNKERGIALVNKAIALRRLQKPSQGLRPTFDAIALSYMCDDTSLRAFAFNVLSDIFRSLGEDRFMLASGLRAFHIGTVLGDEDSTAAALLNICTSFAASPESSVRIHAHKQLLILAERFEQERNWRSCAECHGLLAQIERQDGNLEAYARHIELKYHSLSIVPQQDLADSTKKSGVELVLHHRDLQLREELVRRAATEEVLKSMLPTVVANRLITGDSVAELFPSVSILFIDIVNFTAIADVLEPMILIEFLNAVFDRFDDLAEQHGCERLKTVGDGYMAVAGLPEKCPDHAMRIARLAVDMMRDFQVDVSRWPDMAGSIREFAFRVGIHCGQVIAGKVGTRRFQYDVYGDAVNVAARMESHGLPDRIQCSQAFVEEYHRQEAEQGASGSGRSNLGFVERGTIQVKGKGPMTTYWLQGPVNG